MLTSIPMANLATNTLDVYVFGMGEETHTNTGKIMQTKHGKSCGAKLGPLYSVVMVLTTELPCKTGATLVPLSCTCGKRV